MVSLKKRKKGYLVTFSEAFMPAFQKSSVAIHTIIQKSVLTDEIAENTLPLKSFLFTLFGWVFCFGLLQKFSQWL